MSTIRPQAISGVRAGTENVITSWFPSIASTWIGRMLGSLYTLIPFRINGVPLSYLLFCLPTAPLGAAGFLLLKVAGEKYVLTSHHLQVWHSLGIRMMRQVALEDVAEILVERHPGQAFYKAGNLVLLGADGSVLVEMAGISSPEVARQTLLEARDARGLVQASLHAIGARQPA